MPDDMDWLMAPVSAGLCKYESLKDCTLNLYDIALLNDLLTVRQENEHRAHEAAMRKANG